MNRLSFGSPRTRLRNQNVLFVSKTKHIVQFSNDVTVEFLMQGRLVSSQSWYKSARFENKIQNENYQKVITDKKNSNFLNIDPLFGCLCCK